MSDIETTEPPRTPAGLFEHWCEQPGCTRWGSFGYAVGRADPRWFCGEHRAIGERQAYR